MNKAVRASHPFTECLRQHLPHRLSHTPADVERVCSKRDGCGRQSAGRDVLSRTSNVSDNILPWIGERSLCSPKATASGWVRCRHGAAALRLPSAGIGGRARDWPVGLRRFRRAPQVGWGLCQRQAAVPHRPPLCRCATKTQFLDESSL